MKKSTRVILSVVTAMLLSSIFLFVVKLENHTIESVGVGVIVFLSVMLFADWKSK